MSKLFYLSILFLFSFLDPAQAQEFEFKTTPAGAEVFVKVDADKKPVKIGVSPIKMPAEEVFKISGASKSFIIEVKKDGFEPYQIMLVKTPHVEYKMEVLLNVSKEIKTIKEHDLLIGELFKAQRLIRSNNTSEAIAKLDELEKDFKDFSVISELKGIAYYMQKDLSKALSMFRMAFGKNSKNTDAYKMKVYLEKRMGIDAEAR